ncbi:MAG: DUF3604 domain-containing protein, partial [Chloroflexota bacterium]|nr:DUF3604 domain-containing protein [Chloroflexota bacterium]
MAPGERLVLTYGDRSGGGPGSRAQTFQEARRYFWVDVDTSGMSGTSGSGGAVTLADPSFVTIVGGDAVRLGATAPSTVVAGVPFRLLVRAEDSWGNPAPVYRGAVGLRSDGIRLPFAAHSFTAADGGVWWLEGCVAPAAGLSTVVVEGADAGGAGLITESNPIRCTAQAPLYALHWGDPHGGQVADAAKIRDFFRYARDVAGIAFAGYQRNDHVHSNEAYAVQQAAEWEFHEPGRFVPLPGFEWSGEPSEGGHHNVYFRRHGQPMRRNSHWGLEDVSDVDTDLPHVRDLHRAYRGSDTLITPHVGGGHADLRHHAPGLEPALEITSTHGTFEWFLRESLERGYAMGFVGGSDSHDGRPGADAPGFQERRYARGGLTALYATDLTLEAIHEALAARRCYATSGARILVHVDVDGHPMGAAYRTALPPTITIFVAGSAPLESVELFRGLERIALAPLESPTPKAAPRRVRLLWEGASRRMSYSGVIWDGALTVSGARIKAVETIRFDSPRSRLLDRSEQGLRWHSVTCGYRSGLLLDLDLDLDIEAGADVELRCVGHTSLITRPFFGGHGDADPARMAYAPAERFALTCGLRDLDAGPQELAIGPLDRKLTFSLAPALDGPRATEFATVDAAPGPGTNPYWVRVTQTDMEMAWTSPVFVDYVTSMP